MASTTETTAVVRELTIAARPETVWEFLVDPVKAQRWMGVSVSFEPHPGGEYRVEVVPGVSSLTAASARAGQPLALKNEVLAVIPAPLPDEAIAARLQGHDAAVILKLGRHIGRVRALLGQLGRAADARYVEHATMSNERVARLEEAPDPAPYFSLILVPAQS